MTATRPRVDAAAVTFEDLAGLETGTTLSWGQQVGTHGVPYSPIAGDASPDYTAYVDEAVGRVRLVRFGLDGLVADADRTLPEGALRVADVLNAAGVDTPVCAFSTSIEPDRTGDWDVPWVAVWTGPVWDAADVVADLPSSGLQGCRLRHRGVLSHRVNTVEARGADPRERLHLQQHTGGEWVLRGGNHYPDLPRHRRDDLHTLEDVLSWAEGVLAGQGVAEGRLTAFAVSSRDDAAPLTVWVW